MAEEILDELPEKKDKEDEEEVNGIKVIDTFKEHFVFKPKYLTVVPAFLWGIFLSFFIIISGYTIIGVLENSNVSYFEGFPWAWARFLTYSFGFGVLMFKDLPAWAKLGQRVYIANEVITFSSGVFREKKISLPFRTISAVSRSASIWERIIGCEDVTFYGYGGFAFTAEGMSMPRFSPYEDRA